jgi:AmpD protein
MIGRRGEVITLIDETARAYHAGLSLMPLEVDRRENVNNFSIGIELIGSDRDKFTKRQYDSLSKLMLGIINRHPIRYVLGHEHVAPGRKTDPGPGFDWQRLIALKDSFSELILPQDLRNPWG